MGLYKLFSLEYCPYSRNAEELFKKSSAKYNVINVKQEEKNMYKTSFINTFPQIYYEEVLIGGLSELKLYIQHPDKKIIPMNEVHNETCLNMCRKSISKRFKQL